MDTDTAIRRLDHAHKVTGEVLPWLLKVRMGRAEYQKVLVEVDAAMLHLDRAMYLLERLEE